MYSVNQRYNNMMGALKPNSMFIAGPTQEHPIKRGIAKRKAIRKYVRAPHRVRQFRRRK